VSNPRKLVPSYLKHKQSGRARAVWTDQAGVRHNKLLPGEHDSAESKAAYVKLVAECAAASAVTDAPPNVITVNEVLLAYLVHAQQHYRTDDGSASDEIRHLKTVSRYVRELYGNTPAIQFGPKALKAVRERFIGERWCRKVVNARVERVRRIFKWAVAEELIPASVSHALEAVTGLQRGRTQATESEPVGPVDDAVVDATLAHVNRHVGGLIEFQRLTGCRPGEACVVRRCDIDASSDGWVYKPASHKTAWKGKDRTIPIGPKAQALLKQFFTPDIGDYLFSPRRAVEEFRAERSAKRKTPRYDSHMKRNETKRVGAKRRRPPGKRYNRLGYLTAVTRACDRAFPPPPELAPKQKDNGKMESRAAWWKRLDKSQQDAVKAWRKAHHWHPNQLRHSYATKVRKAFDLEAAQVMLGHARADVTQVYAEKNGKLAAKVAAVIG
jgi:integrase